MKLKNYQIDAIVETVYKALENKREELLNNIKDKDIKKYLDYYKEYEKINKQMEDLGNKRSEIIDSIRKEISLPYYNYTSVMSTKETFSKEIKNAIVKEIPNRSDIRNKIIIKDLSSNFDIDTLIKEMLSEYEKI